MLTKTDMHQIRSTLASRAANAGRGAIGHAKAMAKPAAIGAGGFYLDRYLRKPDAPLSFYRDNWWGPGATFAAAAVFISKKHPAYGRDLAVLAGYKLAEGFANKPNAQGFGDAANVQWPAPPAPPAPPPAPTAAANAADDDEAAGLQGTPEPASAAPDFWTLGLD